MIKKSIVISDKKSNQPLNNATNTKSMKVEESKGKQSTEIANSPLSNYNFDQFLSLSKSYYKELKEIHTAKETLSDNDILILKDLIKETVIYTKILIKQNHLLEAKEIIEVYIKFNEFISDLFHIDNSNNINYAPSLIQICIYELNFQINFILKYYKDAEHDLNCILRLQRGIKLPKFFLGCTYFYLATIQFGNYNILITY